MDGLVLVALALNAALSLGQVARPPRAVQVMQCHQAILDVGTRAHCLCTAQQHPHLAGAHLGEQLFFSYLGVGLMDKAICSAGTPLAMSFCRMSSYTVKAGSGSGSGTASSNACSVGLSSAFAAFLAGRAWGVEMSQKTSCV